MIFIVSIVIGIFSISLVSVLPSTIAFFSLILISLVSAYGSYISVIFCIKSKANYITYYQISQWALWLVFGYLVGISYGYISANSIINKQLPIDLDNKVFIVDGLVTGLVKNSPTSVQLDLIINDLFLVDDNKQLSILDEHKYKKIRLSSYRHNKKFND